MQFEFIRDVAGVPTGAKATVPLEIGPDDVHARLRKLSGKTELHDLLHGIPMVRSLTRKGDVVAIQMQFKVAFLSVNFGVKGRLVTEGENAVVFKYQDGEPKDAHLRFDLAPGASPHTSVVTFTVSFDLDSLGFVAKYFLKHHPEIRPGIFAGVAYSVSDSIARGFA